MRQVPKKAIQEYWTRNVPGLDIAFKKFTPEDKEFYIEADNYRFRYEGYVIPVIDSFLKKDIKVLEIGCGLGSDSRYISGKGADIISLDLSIQNVFFTLKGMRLLNLNGKGICADAENLPFKDNSFDAVYSFGVLHHTPQTQKAIREVYRVLRPYGECAIMLYHKGYAYYCLLLLYGWIIKLAGKTQEELMSRYDHTPLSKMYSKKEIRNMFAAFKDLNIEVTTYGGIQVHRFLRYVWFILNKSKFLMRYLGTFLIIRATKPLSAREQSL